MKVAQQIESERLLERRESTVVVAAWDSGKSEP